MHGHLLANYLDIINDHLLQLIRRILALTGQLVYLGTELPKYRHCRPHGSTFEEDHDLFAVPKPAVVFLFDTAGYPTFFTKYMLSFNATGRGIRSCI